MPKDMIIVPLFCEPNFGGYFYELNYTVEILG